MKSPVCGKLSFINAGVILKFLNKILMLRLHIRPIKTDSLCKGPSNDGEGCFLYLDVFNFKVSQVIPMSSQGCETTTWTLPNLERELPQLHLSNVL